MGRRRAARIGAVVVALTADSGLVHERGHVVQRGVSGAATGSSAAVCRARGRPASAKPVSRPDDPHFMVTLFTTVGFGDLSPVSDVARALTTVQTVGAGLARIGALVGWVAALLLPHAPRRVPTT